MSAILLHFPDMLDLPNRIRELREAADLSQQELADLVGCSKMQISGLERGKPQLDVLWMQRLAAPLGVCPGDLLNASDNPGASISRDEAQFLEMYRSASPQGREQLARIGEILTGFTHEPDQSKAAA